MHFVINKELYNNPSYSRILIGSRLWSIRGQMHDWCHHYKVFPHTFFKIKMAETYENVGHIVPDWRKEDIEESLAKAVTMYEKQEEWKTRFFVENDLQNILEQSQSNMTITKRNSKWVLKLNFKKFNFSQSQNNYCWCTLMSRMKHHYTTS